MCSFSSFVESQGQALLDLSLYVSSENYNAVTRPLFSTIQSFPLTWIAPQKLRAAAKARTAHLGLSALDIDADDAAPPAEPSVVPESLRRPQQPTVTSLLAAHPESAAQIRLAALATAFFAPLQHLRGQRRFFVAARPTSLDCLALGYLALALFPDLPSPWLADCLRRDFPQLCAFVHDAQRLFFGGAVALADAGLALPEVADAERERRARGKGALPWTRDENGGLLAVGAVLVAHVADSIPVVAQLVRARRMQEAVERAAEEDPEAGDELALAQHRIEARRREVYVAVGSVVAGLGLFVGFMFQQGILAALGGGGGKSRGRVDGDGFEVVEGEEAEDGGWDRAEPGVAALAQQMDFLSDLQFGNPQGDTDQGNIAPEGVI